MDELTELARVLRAEHLKLRLDVLERLIDESPIETKALALPDWSIKAADDGSVSGYLAVFDNLDKVKDVIHQGSFARTLGEAKSFAQAHRTDALYPLLWQHDQHEPIGAIVSAHEDSHGLYIQTHLNLDIERGRQAYDGLKAGYLSL